MFYKNDIVVRSRKFVCCIVKAVERMPKGMSVFSIGKQVIDSAGSVGANMVEARFGRTAKEFISSARISLKEVNETMFWLDTLNDLHLLPSEKYASLKQEASEIAKVIAVIIKNYRKNNKALKS
ncbi:four helix bundle protein [Patescibacteria group bacterium]